MLEVLAVDTNAVWGDPSTYPEIFDTGVQGIYRFKPADPEYVQAFSSNTYSVQLMHASIAVLAWSSLTATAVTTALAWRRPGKKGSRSGLDERTGGN